LPAMGLHCADLGVGNTEIVQQQKTAAIPPR